MSVRTMPSLSVLRIGRDRLRSFYHPNSNMTVILELDHGPKVTPFPSWTVPLHLPFMQPMTNLPILAFILDAVLKHDGAQHVTTDLSWFHFSQQYLFIYSLMKYWNSEFPLIGFPQQDRPRLRRVLQSSPE